MSEKRAVDVNAPARVGLWLRAMRAPFLSASVVLVLVGGAVSLYATGAFDVFYFLLTLLGIAVIHIGANMVNDYFDDKSGTDRINAELTPFSGGSRVIQENALDSKTMYRAGIAFFAAGTLIGIILGVMRGWPIFILGLFGVFTSYLYTETRVNLAGRGLGEIVLALNFGPLTTVGTYFVQTMSYTPADYAAPVLAGVIMGALIGGILWINQFPDFEADRKSNKRNWVVRLGKARSVWMYALLIGSAYVFVVIGALTGLFPRISLIMFLTVPIAYRAISIARRHYNDTKNLIPANASTIQITTFNGLLLAGALVLGTVI